MSTVGDRGQITIEKRLRTSLGVNPGDKVVQRIEGSRLIVEFLPSLHTRSIGGMLRSKVTRWPLDDAWDALREAAGSTPDPDRSGQ